MSDIRIPSLLFLIIIILAVLTPFLAAGLLLLWRRQEQWRAERGRMRHSQAQLRSLLDRSQMGIILVDEQYQIVDANERMAQMVHYTVEEMVGSDFRRYLTQDSRSVVIDRYNRRQLGKPVSARYEFFVRTKGGERRRMEVSSTLVYQNDGRIYTMAQVWDITEQPEIYAALTRRTQQLSALYRTALELNTERDVEALLYGIVRRALKLLQRESGGISLYRAEQDLMEWVVEVGEPLTPLGFTLQRGEGLVGRVWMEKAPILDNAFQAGPEQEGKSADFSGAVIAVPIQWGEQFLGVLTIVDFKKRPFIPDDADLLSQFAAQAAIAIQNARFYHHAQQELVERRQVEQELTAHLEQLEEIVDARTQSLRQRTQQLEQQTIALARAKEAAEAAQAEAEAQREKAEMANRSKSQFLANVSHELRTPLNAVMGYAQILLRDPDLSEWQKERLSIIQESGQHLLTLINDILDLSKIEADRMELSPVTVHIFHFLREIANIAEMRAQQTGIKFRYEFDGNLPPGMMVDEKRLRQVLDNLLDNAIKFTESGEIWFRVSATAVSSDHHRVRFEVEDTGIGIARDALEQIFQPFAQAGGEQQRAQGTGLGLSITQRLVALMGGTLHVESEVEQGATFWFELTLPMADLPARQLEDKRRVTGYVGPTREALVVEDNPINRRLLRDMLLDLGFAVEVAGDGETAVIQAQAHPPHIIFMDLVMPNISGFEAVRRLRQIPCLADTVIIAVSASPYPADRQRSRRAGCDDFLAKPISVHTLQRCLQAYLNLEWVYMTELGKETAVLSDPIILTSSEDAFAVPAPLQMEALLDLARRGDMRGVQAWAARIKNENITYAPFADQLIALAQGYEEQAILTLVRRYVPQ